MNHPNTHPIDPSYPHWQEVVLEDEQFWVWTHFTLSFAVRGEYHEAVRQIEDLREILENWQSRLDLLQKKNFKKVGNRFQPEFLERMKKTFCPAHADGLKEAFKNLIKIQLQQRALIERAVEPQWTVSSKTISRIQTLAQTFSN